MAGDIWVTYFSKFKMACNELSSDNNVYIKMWNLIALFHFENRQVFLPHPVLVILPTDEISAWNLPVPNVQYKSPDDGQRRCPKHVELYNIIILDN